MKGIWQALTRGKTKPKRGEKATKYCDVDLPPLPHEILFCIFSYDLDLKDLTAVSMVCQEWRR